jgi:hypothetical protein
VLFNDPLGSSQDMKLMSVRINLDQIDAIDVVSREELVQCDRSYACRRFWNPAMNRVPVFCDCGL